MSDIPDDYYDRAVEAIAATAARLSFGSHDAAIMLLCDAIGALSPKADPGSASRLVLDALDQVAADLKASLPKASNAAH